MVWFFRKKSVKHDFRLSHLLFFDSTKTPSSLLEMNMGIMKFFLIVPIFLLMFSGCTALKQRKDAPEVLEAVAIKLPLGSDFIKGDWPAYNWWTLFEDKQLNGLIEETLEGNFDLKASIARLRRAQAQARQARSPLLPQLSAKGEDNYQHLSHDGLVRRPPSLVPAVVNQIDLALNFEYEIDLFGKNRQRYQAAIGREKAQRAEMSQALLMITTALTATYFDYQSQLATLKISRDLLEARQAYVDLVHLRVENGVDDQIILENAHVLLLGAEESVAILEKEVAIGESQLKILMGLGPDDPREFETPTSMFNHPFPLPETIPVDLLARRPDLMAQIWRVEAAAHMIGAAKAAFFPNINLAAFVGLESLKFSKLFSMDSFAAALNPAVNLPIFKGGKLRAQLEESHADFDTAVYDYNTLLLQASKEVSDQLKTLQLTNKQGIFQSEVMNQLIHVSDLTLMRFEKGLDNSLTLMNIQIEVLNAGLKEITIQNARHLAVLNLIKSLGGGYISDGRKE